MKSNSHIEDGWAGSSKAFFFELSMPHSSSKCPGLSDAPAVWILNAKVPRTLQYNLFGQECNCHDSGCGEMDFMEVIDDGDNRCVVANHPHGTDPNYIPRPTNKTIKLAAVINGATVSVQVLDDGTVFTEKMAKALVVEILEPDMEGDHNSVFKAAS
jgi:hypothetical protein